MNPNRQQRRHAKRHGRAALALLVASALAAGALPAMSVEAAEGPALLIQGGGGGGWGGGGSAGGGGGGGYVEYYVDATTTYYAFGGGGAGNAGGSGQGGGSISGGAGYGNTLEVGGGGRSGTIAGGTPGGMGGPGQGMGNVSSAPTDANGAGTPASNNMTTPWSGYVLVEKGGDGASGSGDAGVPGGTGAAANVTYPAGETLVLQSLTIYGGELGGNSNVAGGTGGAGGTATFKTAGTLSAKEIVLGQPTEFPYTRTQADVNLNVGTLISRKDDTLTINNGGNDEKVNISQYSSGDEGIYNHEFDLTGVTASDPTPIREISGGTIRLNNDASFELKSIPSGLQTGTIITLLGRKESESGAAVDVTSGSFSTKTKEYEGNKSVEIKIENGDLVMVVVGKAETLYTVTMDSATPAGSGSASVTPAGATAAGVAAGASVTLTATATGGYTFSHWTVSGAAVNWTAGGSTSSTATFDMPARNVTVSPVFSPSLYTVTMNAATPTDSGSGSVAPVGATAAGVVADTLITLTASPADTYTFTHWLTSPVVTWTDSAGVALDPQPELQGNPTAYFRMPAAHINITPHFARTYGITRRVSPTGGGSVSSSQNGVAVDRAMAGSTIRLRASAKTGFRFREWQLEVQDGETGAWTAWMPVLFTVDGVPAPSASLRNATIYLDMPSPGQNIRATARFSGSAPHTPDIPWHPTAPAATVDEAPPDPPPDIPGSSGLPLDSVKTGDPAPTFAWLILLSFSILGLAGIYLWQKKKGAL